jgi:hypothetical protein
LLKGKLKPVNIYEVRGWDPEAYLESRGKDDVTETLQVCWADHCPSGKIVGYQLHFEEQFRRTQHPLAQELAEFFQSQQGIAGERNTAVMVKEICDNGTYYLSLNERFEAITNKTLSEIPKGAWKEKMTTWAKGLKQHLDLLEQEYRGNPEADKLHRDLLDVYEKIEAQEERLELEMELPGPLSKSWDDIRAYASTAFETDDTDHQERIDELNNIYKETASGLVASVSKRMDEYHAMMALAGSMTEKEKRGCETYAKALSLHWERKWDESLEAFEACLVDLPGDKAAMEFIGRVKRYKDDPPPESWQGEFKQTKK